MENFINNYLDIAIFAIIAVVLLWRLRSVLGTRNENDAPPYQPGMVMPQDKNKKNGKLKEVSGTVTFPDKTIADQKNVPAKSWTQNLPDFNFVESATVHNALTQLPAFDPEFRPDDFMEKARKSFVLIVQAYAGGNKATLEMLLSPTLYHHFAEQIDARDSRKETYFTQLYGLQKAVISDASLDGSKARITVDFVAEQAITHKDADGKFIDGREGKRVVTRDRWVFTRDLKSVSPFWILDTTLEHAE